MAENSQLKIMGPDDFSHALDLAQVGAGRVVDFKPRPKLLTVPTPVGVRQRERLAVFEVSGTSLDGLGLRDGDLLTCKLDFERFEAAGKLCVVRIVPTNEKIAKIVRPNGDGTITLAPANPEFSDRVLPGDEVEILAIALEVRRRI